MKPKILITTVLLTVSCLLITYHCSAQNWQWANSAGGQSQDNSVSICNDNNGNIYITGRIMLYETYFHTDTFAINGFNDFFLAKYDAAGNEVWVKQYGGPNTDMINIHMEGPSKIIYDSNTNAIFMTGSFYDYCLFDTVLLSSSTHDNQLFIAKFNINGNCIWAKSAGGVGYDCSYGILVLQNNTILISGSLENDGYIDTIPNTSGKFIAKYNNLGHCLWTKNIFIGCSATSLLEYNGDIFGFGGGGLKDTITIDTIHLLAGTNYLGKVLARFDSVGHVKWAKLIGGPHASGGLDFSMDANGNCYFTGNFTGGYAVFGSDTIHADTTDFFVAKYDQDGNLKWIQQGNASIQAKGLGVFSNSIGETYVVGSFAGNIDFGSYNITSSTSQDLFIARYDSSGNCLGVRNTGFAEGTSVISDASSCAYITGSFIDTTNFGSNTLISHGNSDIFVAKIDAFTGIGGGLKTTNNQLLIYANPNSGKCNINIPDEFVKEKNLTLTIFDVSGKIIQQKTLALNDGKIKLDLQAEAKGIYNVSLTNGKKMYSGKIVFE